MIRNVLGTLSEAAVTLPLVALVMFVLFFILLVAWTVRLRPGHIRHMESLPLEQDPRSIDKTNKIDSSRFPGR